MEELIREKVVSCVERDRENRASAKRILTKVPVSDRVVTEKHQEDISEEISFKTLKSSSRASRYKIRSS